MVHLEILTGFTQLKQFYIFKKVKSFPFKPKPRQWLWRKMTESAFAFSNWIQTWPEREERKDCGCVWKVFWLFPWRTIHTTTHYHAKGCLSPKTHFLTHRACRAPTKMPLLSTQRTSVNTMTIHSLFSRTHWRPLFFMRTDWGLDSVLRARPSAACLWAFLLDSCVSDIIWNYMTFIIFTGIPD